MSKGREEITSKEIGIAYIRFASVYNKFEEPEDFRRLHSEVKK